MLLVAKMLGLQTYNCMAINSNNKIKPGLQGYLGVFVAEDLEAEGVVIRSTPRLLDGFTVQAAHKSI
jgi:hypothetical protein